MSARNPVERGRWLYYAPLHDCFYEITARRVVTVHDDGTATYIYSGTRRQVDTDSVLNAVRSRSRWQSLLRREERKQAKAKSEDVQRAPLRQSKSLRRK